METTAESGFEISVKKAVLYTKTNGIIKATILILKASTAVSKYFPPDKDDAGNAAVATGGVTVENTAK